MRSARVRPKNPVLCSNERCQELLARVKALGSEVVPEVKPSRKTESAGPSTRAGPDCGQAVHRAG